jgi:type IV pilus assembly protein PilV
MHLIRSRAQFGITLMEVLVTLFIVSVGLLGVAGLHSVSMFAGHTATNRSLAVLFSAEIADRMRANRGAVASYDNAITSTGSNNNCTDTASSSAGTCTPLELVQDDVFHWNNAVTEAYVNMSPVVTVTVNVATVPSVVTIVLNWTERGDVLSYVTSLRI